MFEVNLANTQINLIELVDSNEYNGIGSEGLNSHFIIGMLANLIKVLNLNISAFT